MELKTLYSTCLQAHDSTSIYIFNKPECRNNSHNRECLSNNLIGILSDFNQSLANQSEISQTKIIIDIAIIIEIISASRKRSRIDFVLFSPAVNRAISRLRVGVIPMSTGLATLVAVRTGR